MSQINKKLISVVNFIICQCYLTFISYKHELLGWVQLAAMDTTKVDEKNGGGGGGGAILILHNGTKTGTHLCLI